MGMEFLLTMLAQELSPENRRSALIWLGVIAGVVLVGGMVVMLIRRKFAETPKGNDEMDTGFSLSRCSRGSPRDGGPGGWGGGQVSRETRRQGIGGRWWDRRGEPAPCPPLHRLRYFLRSTSFHAASLSR